MTEKEYKLLLSSVEKICAVIKQKILKGQQINAMEILKELHKIYVDIITKHENIKNDLSRLLTNHYKELLELSNSKYYEMISEMLEKEIEFINR